MPIVATTAHALDEEKQAWLNKGMDDFLTKPLREEVLEQILDHWLNSSHSSTHYQANISEQAQQNNIETSDNQHVNWQESLKQAMGKEDLALDMLQMLIDSIPHNIIKIEQAMNMQDDESLLKIIHKLHGACCYTGVPQLKKLSHSIETALKQHSSIANIEPELLEILDELQLVATVGASQINKTSDTLND